MATADHAKGEKGQDAVRITIKQVAQAANVHYSTVSLALQGRGRIPAATLERIRQIAEKIGYKQDSVMQSLAAQRSRCVGLHREPRMVFVTNRWLTDDPSTAAFMGKFADGARHQAELMGCAFDLLPIDDERITSAEIEDRIDPRRTDGIILGALSPGKRQPEVDWSTYAVVRIESAFMLPEAVMVGNDQMQIACMALRNVHRLGYRRIGMAVGQVEDESTRNLYSAGYYVAQDELAIPETPVLYLREHVDGSPEQSRRLVDWIKAHRLEIVLSSWSSIGDLLRGGGMRVPGDVACVCLCLNAPDPVLAGVIQHHFVVGQKAAEALALLIMRRKRGLPTPSAATYVAGTWQEGSSAPPCGTREA